MMGDEGARGGRSASVPSGSGSGSAAAPGGAMADKSGSDGGVVDRAGLGSASAPSALRRDKTPSGGGGVLAAWALAERELVRFFRQPNRVIGAIGQPLIFWVLFGAAFQASFRGPGGASYAQFFLPGIAALIVLFTAIFSTISIIEDRNAGFLQGVLVAPVARGWMVGGKVLGGTILAVLQAALFLALAPLVGTPVSPANWLAALGVLGLLGFSLTSLGFCLAWRMDSTQGFHAIMSILLMPMWLLSGSFFPAEGVTPWLGWLIRLNPMTYGVSALRHALGMPAPIGIGTSLAVSFTFGTVVFVLAMRLARRAAKGDLK